MKKRWYLSSSLPTNDRSDPSRVSSSKTLTTGFLQRFPEIAPPFFLTWTSSAQKEAIRNR